MEYTPGNWKVYKNTPVVMRYNEEYEEDGVIARVFNPDTPFIPSRKLADLVALSNAHLVSAAPALYEALKTIIERLDKGLALGETIDKIPGRIAIAKAEGK